MPQLQNLELSQLKESKTNPRQRFDKTSMAELVASIGESGIVTPLLVRTAGNSHFEIVDGARRFRAAQEAKLASIPVVVRELNDEEALLVQIV
jgi:ParB family chromosome partitioning protein